VSSGGELSECVGTVPRRATHSRVVCRRHMPGAVSGLLRHSADSCGVVKRSKFNDMPSTNFLMDILNMECELKARKVVADTILNKDAVVSLLLRLLKVIR